tara:strand:+ start:4118 stop:4375 length:258 start_codon:yes stop_codon:yes gene_type:complete
MQKDYENILKKQIIYRCSYTGTKETDLLFKKLILKKIHQFDKLDLSNILEIFQNYSDHEIFLLLTNVQKPTKKYIKIINKIKNEK